MLEAQERGAALPVELGGDTFDRNLCVYKRGTVVCDGAMRSVTVA